MPHLLMAWAPPLSKPDALPTSAKSLWQACAASAPFWPASFWSS
jgi:hypothetical protein